MIGLSRQLSMRSSSGYHTYSGHRLGRLLPSDTQPKCVEVLIVAVQRNHENGTPVASRLVDAQGFDCY